MHYQCFKINNFVEFSASNSTNLSSIIVPESTKNISCFNCNLNSINVSSLESLETLSIGSNALSNIDISNNLLLQELRVGDNQLTSLDISQNSNLIDLRIANNLLTTLNAKNGNNVNMSIMYATGNLNLSCIDVDNEMDATDNIGNYINWQKPAITIYSENCASLTIDEFNQKKIILYPNPTTSHFSISSNQNIDTVDVFNVLGRKVKTFQLIETEYDISNLQNGIYFIVISSSNKKQTIKLIKK